MGVLTVLLLGGGVTALVLVVMGTEILYTLGSALISVSLLRKHIGFRIWGGLAAVRDRRKEILRFLLHTNISGTLKMSTDKLVMVIVGALGGAPVAAQYKVASQAGTSLMLFSDPFYQVIYPPLSKMVARREWAAVFGGLRRLQGVLFAVVLPLGAVISGLIVVLITPVFGEGFTPAIWPAIVILWAVVPNVLFFWRRPLSLSLGLAGQLVRYRGVVSLLQLIMTILLIRPLGVMGAAAGMFVMQWLYALLEIRLVSFWRRKLLHGSAVTA